MERIIKFRAWIDSDKMMYDVLQFQAKFPKEDFYRVFINKERIEGQPMNYRITGKNAIMQFTGLHDKNGKEIYEGDIVIEDVETEYGETKVKHEVEFNAGAFYPVCMQPSTTFEIIGNIYENHELLKPTNA